MARWDDDDAFFRQPRDRKQVVAEELARLVTPDNSDPPEIAARKKREAAARLKREDQLFGNYWGASLGVPWEMADDTDRPD
jgi:hypothetical protein